MKMFCPIVDENAPWSWVTGSGWELLWLEIIQGQFQPEKGSKKELSRHEHRLRINTLLSVRSIWWPKKHDSARSVIFLRNPFFTSSAIFCSGFVCTI